MNALVEHDPNRSVAPMDMLDRALTSGASPETLDKLMSLAERWEANQARKAFDAAIADAKAEIPPILKNRLVDFTGKTGVRTHYKHEDLAEIARTVDPILAKHGLSYRFRTQSPPGEPVAVTCIVSHRAGYSEENTLVGPRDESGNKNALQSIGSTVTFLQRYTLKAALGLAAANVDDDGRASSGQSEPERINPKQLERLQTLLEETKSDAAAFCQLANPPLESLADMLVADFDSAVRLLEQRKAKMAGKAA